MYSFYRWRDWGTQRWVISQGHSADKWQSQDSTSNSLAPKFMLLIMMGLTGMVFSVNIWHSPHTDRRPPTHTHSSQGLINSLEGRKAQIWNCQEHPTLRMAQNTPTVIINLGVRWAPVDPCGWTTFTTAFCKSGTENRSKSIRNKKKG